MSPRSQHPEEVANKVLQRARLTKVRQVHHYSQSLGHSPIIIPSILNPHNRCFAHIIPQIARCLQIRLALALLKIQCGWEELSFRDIKAKAEKIQQERERPCDRLDSDPLSLRATPHSVEFLSSSPLFTSLHLDATSVGSVSPSRQKPMAICKTLLLQPSFSDCATKTNSLRSTQLSYIEPHKLGSLLGKNTTYRTPFMRTQTLDSGWDSNNSCRINIGEAEEGGVCALPCLHDGPSIPTVPNIGRMAQLSAMSDDIEGQSLTFSTEVEVDEIHLSPNTPLRELDLFDFVNLTPSSV
ncbi:hypothetical protein FSARC_8813 [Fusarium sarcochroum]|uniref:Uncharacterized protein n=1 Tax=Fusarium sarcochroum TaxID=1208366 RepID=A0A8H4TS70_9HYPO|nr:hypothetical protein FSARC_8813 [Fusarium sarcochroum]